MTAALEKLLPELAALDFEDRQYIRQYLDGLAQQQNGDPLDDGEDPDFIDEINRRVESIRDGTAKMSPADEVFRRIDEKLKSMREAKI